MNFNKIDRKIHYWTGVIIALPALVIFCTGLLLQVKKQWDWVQPTEYRGTGTIPGIDLEGILSVVRGVPGLGVAGWDDVNRLDVRPGRGLVKVWLHSGWEVQVDLGTGRVLHAAYRRSDLIESIHDGSFWAGKISKVGLGLTVGIALLVLLATGVGMFRFSLAKRRKIKNL